MFARNKLLLFGAAGFAALWAILYTVLVSGNWTARDEEDQAAQENLERWAKFYKKDAGYVPIKDAHKALKDERARIGEAMKELEGIEFGPTKLFQKYTLAAVGSGDPNNYFDRMRNELAETAEKRLNIALSPGLSDLCFRGPMTEQPVGLNLLRLFILRRFLNLAHEAHAVEISNLKYSRPFALPTGEEAAAPATGEEPPAAKDRLFQVPLQIRLKITEKNLGTLLCELQRPSDANRSYFVLRGFQIEVRDAGSGLLEAEIGVGALFPEAQFIGELGIPYKEDEKKGWQQFQPALPSRY
ncbi:MAG: hypothetical protein M5U26_14775 [Planctomycetota bacterium]|nr:hypothetical protein [Planctomycetota bacterium]